MANKDAHHGKRRELSPRISVSPSGNVGNLEEDKVKHSVSNAGINMRRESHQKSQKLLTQLNFSQMWKV